MGGMALCSKALEGGEQGRGGARAVLVLEWRGTVIL
jgi:hypothetical protein